MLLMSAIFISCNKDKDNVLKDDESIIVTTGNGLTFNDKFITMNVETKVPTEVGGAYVLEDPLFYKLGKEAVEAIVKRNNEAGIYGFDVTLDGKKFTFKFLERVKFTRTNGREWTYTVGSYF